MATLIKRKDKYFVQIRRKGLATVCRSFHLRSDAEEWARDMEVRADRRDMPAPVRVLDSYKVRHIIERYRDTIIVNKRGAEVETYIVNAFLRHPIAELSLGQATTAQFSRYRDERLKGVQPVTVNRELGVIKHAFDIAMREWDIPLRDNPLCKLRKLKVQNARNRRPEPAELEALEAAGCTCRNPYFMPLVRLAIETGMRRGELLGMEWGHIDRASRTLFIPVTKNGFSRTIPLTHRAIAVLDGLQSLGDAEPKMVFRAMTAAAADSAWDRLVTRAKIKNLHFHDLRHEAISRFFELGLSVPEVALISGHRDYRMLFRYTHLKAEDLAMKLHSH